MLKRDHILSDKCDSIAALAPTRIAADLDAAGLNPGLQLGEESSHATLWEGSRNQNSMGFLALKPWYNQRF